MITIVSINNKIKARYLLIIKESNILLSLFHFLLTYSLVMNLLGLPQYKHVGEVCKIKFLHCGHFFFSIVKSYWIKSKSDAINKISNLNLIYYILNN